MLIGLTCVAALLALGAAAVCRRIGWVDRPDARKRHLGDVPLAGGLSIFAAWLLAITAGRVPVFTPETLPVIAAVFLLGMLDDRVQLRPALRLQLHYAAGLAMALYAGVRIHSLGDLLGIGDLPLLLLSVPLTALAFAGLANAFNMVDGIDGLAAVTLAVPLGTLAALAHLAGHPMAPMLAALLIPLAVFTCFNLGPDRRWLPRIFLGDAGSVTLGFLVCAALIHFSQGPAAVIRPVTALWLVALPLMDMLATMLLRWREGRHPMQADRSHLHHRLLALGLGPRRTLLALGLWSLCAAAAGLALEAAVPECLNLLLYLILFAGHCLLLQRADRLAARLREWQQRPGADLRQESA